MTRKPGTPQSPLRAWRFTGGLVIAGLAIASAIYLWTASSREGPLDPSAEQKRSDLAKVPGIPQSKRPQNSVAHDHHRHPFAKPSLSPRSFDPANALKTSYAFPQHRSNEYEAFANSDATVSLSEHPNLGVRLSIADPTNGFEKEQTCRKQYRVRQGEGPCAFSLKVVSSSQDGVSGRIVYSQVLMDYGGQTLSPSCKSYAMCFAKAQISKKVIAHKPGLTALRFNSVMRSDFDMHCDQEKLSQAIKTLQEDLQAFAKMPVPEPGKDPRRDIRFAAGQQEQIIEFYRLIQDDCR